MLTIEIPIADKKKPPVLKFSERCVSCGKAKQVILPMKLNMGIQKKNGEAVMMDFPVPLCAVCESNEKRITYVTLLPFVLGGLFFCVLAFIPAWLIAPSGTTLQTRNLDLAIGAFAGILVGLVGGTVVELGLKWLFAPAYGRLLLNRPLTILSLFNDSEDVVGLSARFTENKKSLKLTFENDEIAREFETLNF
ncbi:MAG: hypothetical protein AB1509_03800 [Chloroflexota bacterium]